MELMVNPRHSAGLKVASEIVAVRADSDQEKGVELRWREASTSKSQAALSRFLSRVLGVAEPAVLEDGAAPYRYRYAFPDTGTEALVSALEAMKSRPMKRQSRRTVLNTDPAMGPAKLKDIIGSGAGVAETAPEPEPVVAEPVVAEPVVAEPVVAEPVVAEPVIAEPVVAESVVAESPPVPPAPVDDVVEDSLDTPVAYGVDEGEDGIGGAAIRGSAAGERRLRPRIALSVPVSYFDRSRGTVARAHNVSRSGLYIETPEEPPAVGRRVNVRFPIRHGGGNHVVLLTCEVIRHRSPREKPGTKRGFAVCYLVVDELGRAGLFGHFINQHL